MYEQVLDPVADSLFASSIFAALPLITLFVLLGGLKLKAHVAAVVALASAILVAVFGFGWGSARRSSPPSEALFGIFPIMWIVINAIWVYNMTVKTGHFAVLRRSFGTLSDDQRVQAIIIAFLLRGAARGAGRLRHAGGHHRGHADRPRLQADQGRRGRARGQHRAGGLRRHRHPDHHARRDHRLRRRRAGRDGRPPDTVPGADRAAHPRGNGRRLRGVRQCWPAAVVGGLAFAVAQFLCSNYFSVELTDIVAALAGTARTRRSSSASGPPARRSGPSSARTGPGAGGRRGGPHDPRTEAEIDRRDRGAATRAARSSRPTRRTGSSSWSSGSPRSPPSRRCCGRRSTRCSACRSTRRIRRRFHGRA